MAAGSMDVVQEWWFTKIFCWLFTPFLGGKNVATMQYIIVLPVLYHKFWCGFSTTKVCLCRKVAVLNLCRLV